MSNEMMYSSFGNERYGRSVSELTSTYKSDANVYIAEKTLMIAEKNVVLKQFGMGASLPQGNGRTFQFTRYNRLALPVTALSDGVTPGNTSMTISTVVAQMDQWGAVITITDQASLSIKHGPLPKAIELMGFQASETVDREIYNVLMAGTTIKFKSGSTRAGVGSTDYLNTATVGKTWSALKSTGAMAFDGRSYIGVCDPFVAQDIINDTTFIDAHKYSDATMLYNAEIGTWMGVRWVVSNVIPYVMLMNASSRVAEAVVDNFATPAGGSFAGTEDVFFAYEAVDKNTGHVVEVSTPTQVSGIAGSDKIVFTMPASTDFTYNLYLGGTAITCYQYATGYAASATVEILAPGSVPTSGIAHIALPATGIKVHTSFVIGKEAYAVPELMPIETFITPKVSSDSDPIQQRRKVGWKTDFKAVICNNDFFARIETESAFD